MSPVSPVSRARRGPLALAALLVAALALAGCGLPVSSGVRTPDVPAAQTSVAPVGPGAGAVDFLPPGWRPGLRPVGVVTAFLEAQGSPVDDHAIARGFLAPEERDSWDDDGEVKVYDESTRQSEVIGDEAGDVVTVRLRGLVTSRISATGTLDPTDVPLDEIFVLRRDAQRNWVLAEVPDGLQLRKRDVARSYATQFVHYLAKGTESPGPLVPDPTLLLVDDDRAEALVRRLVAGPSASLQGAVVTAVPPGAQVVSVRTDAAGAVTVDLGPQVAQLSPLDRERLSAQLVWTLRQGLATFSELRLLSDGQPVDVPGVPGDVQDRGAWAAYDPDGLPDRTTTYYIADGRLRSLEGGGGVVPAAEGVAADLAAVAPLTDELAVLTDVGEGRSEVRIGPLREPLPAQAAYTGGGLRSPSWGGGRRGLWLLQTGTDPQVLLVGRDGTAVPVPITEPPPGRLTALRVSRDGARIALVAGTDDASRQVYLAPIVEGDGGTMSIGRPRQVGFDVTDVSDVAWESATSLVAIGRLNDLEPLPLRLAIDGSGEVVPVGQPGLEQLVPVSLAAAPDRPLVVGAERNGEPPVLLRSTAGFFEPEQLSGSAPFYPG